MSEQPLLQTNAPAEQEGSTFKGQLKKCLRKTALVLGAVFLLWLAVTWSIQGVIVWWVTTASGCSASRLQGYTYPGGDSSVMGGPEYNLMPMISLLAERPPMWYGQAMDVIPSNEASSVADAPAGAWWRTWGPWFYTYTYQDVENSRTTLYMRRNLLSIWMSHRIVRCDGKGPLVTFTEGSNWMVNRVRAFFKMNQGSTFKIFLENELVALAEETSSGFESVTFRSTPDGVKMASSILQDRHFHGQYDEWLIKNNKDTKVPFFVTSASTLLFAVHTLLSSAKVDSTARAAAPKLLAALNSTLLAMQEPARASVAAAASSAAVPEAVKADGAREERAPSASSVQHESAKAVLAEEAETMAPAPKTGSSLAADGAAGEASSSETVPEQHV